jgi:hypothetical protein
MTLLAKIHRPSTGENWDLSAACGNEPWRVEDGETFLVNVPKDHKVDLNGVPCLAVTADSKTTFIVDLGVRTIFGAHRIRVHRKHESAHFDLLTSGGLRALERLLPAVEQVEQWMPCIRGGFWYLEVDGRSRRIFDPTRVLAFARDAAPLIEALVREIEQQPATRRTSKLQVRPFGFPVDIQATQRLLTTRPELLQPVDQGPLQIGDGRYAPQLVACRIPAADLLAIENRRIVAFLKSLQLDCRAALQRVGWLDAKATADAEVTIKRLRRIVGRSFLASVSESILPRQGDPPVGLEASHPCYRKLRKLRIEYQAQAGFGLWSDTHRKHVASADRIYQAWCCYLVAHALELTPTTGGLRAVNGPAFRNTIWDLYYDDPSALASWRSHTLRPDSFRPDILLRRREAPSRVILIDAKYTAGDFVDVPGNRLKEVQAYMNAFGLRQAGIMHPGSTGESTIRLRETSAHGHRLLEIGVTPTAVRTIEDLDRLRNTIVGLECIHGETYPEITSVRPET